MEDEYYLLEVFGEDSSFLDTVGGLDEIETAKQVAKQYPQRTSLDSLIRRGSSQDTVISEGKKVLSLIDTFSSEQKKELEKVLTGAKETTDVAGNRLNEVLSSFEGVVNTFNQQLEEQRIRSKEQEELAEKEQRELEAANRRALSGEGLLRETAPARALGIGEIMTSGRAARGGSQRAATSQFLRNPSYRGLK
mgnify:FL=1|jgi:hypothetical protein